MIIQASGSNGNPRRESRGRGRTTYWTVIRPFKLALSESL